MKNIFKREESKETILMREEKNLAKVINLIKQYTNNGK